jgi:hypothetical protein
VAVAVVQTGQGKGVEGLVGPFGSFALEGKALAREGEELTRKQGAMG